MKTVCLTLIKFYRSYLSILIPPCCIYRPTCSQYAMEAFQKYSVPKAFLLSAFRILRCNPFCKGGYDPVP